VPEVILENLDFGSKGASVPTQRNQRAPVRHAIALALCLALCSPALHAAGLGRLVVQSALGQPLSAEVEVTSVAPDEAPTLAVRLASQSAFRQSNLDFNPALSALRFSLERRGPSNFVARIVSLQPINEPYLDLLLELTWATGRVVREYTVLLDPPSLRAAPEVVPPTAVARAPAPAPAPASAVPAVAAPTPATSPPAPAADAAPAPAPVAAPAARAAAAASADSYTVKPGDTLGRIALQNKAPTVSLDQMLVALFRTNPNAFVGDNMNRLVAGRTLIIPSAADAGAITTAEARREVIAQSRDFAQFRSRLAQAATVGAATVAPAPPQAAAAQGRITAKVEDRAAPAKGGDQLQIARADAAAGSPAAAARARDEEVARQRAIKEQEERLAELQRTNEALKKALEVQSAASAQAQQRAEAKAVPPAAAPAPVPAPGAAPSPAPAPAAAPVAAPAAAPAAPPAPVAATPPAPSAAPAEPAKVETPPTPVPVAPPVPKTDTPKKVSAPAPTPPPEPSLVEQLTSPYVLGGAGAALLALLVGLNVYRRRKVEKADGFEETGDGLRSNSLLGATGGQSVDTGSTSTFNSSFIPAASQLDPNEVDPVAEADVYIAYGREEQAEDILKEALRVQPDRHAVSLKLLEIYARRADRASFDAVMLELRNRTGGSGDDWEQAIKLGRAFDPANPMYAGGNVDGSPRGPITALRLNPVTTGGRPAAASGSAGPATNIAPPTRPPRREPFGSPNAAVDGRKGVPVDTRSTPDTTLQVDSLIPPEATIAADSKAASAATRPAGAPSRFRATLSPRDTEPATPPVVAPTFTVSPTPAVAQSLSGGGIDFSALDFDLGPTRMDTGEDTPPVAAPAPDGVRADSAATFLDLPPVSLPSIPDVDLEIPSRVSASTPVSAPALGAPAPAGPALSMQVPPEQSSSPPTVFGDIGSLSDDAPRLSSNTDQATVPLIDFDLSGSDVELGGRRTETQAGSQLASQMATKLDLARGYIDLGVKDGARELIEEVMRDGTRDQRQAAVDLMKQLET
jgi:pilus assembly protein FimV